MKAIEDAPKTGSTLILTGEDVRSVLDLDACIAAVERVLAAHARDGLPAPGVLALPVDGGGFHIKAAAARLGRFYAAAKVNGNFPDNPRRRHLPTIQGVLVLSDASDGRVLAILDSAEITTLRTGATTAVAAKHLARPESSVVTIVGCGVQGRVQLRALTRVLPLRRAWAVDVDPDVARRFAAEMSQSLDVIVTPTDDLARATLDSDVCVTCTPSHRPFLRSEHVRPGAFVAAVGADHPEKQELHPELFRDATIVVDVLEQCVAIGDLHHAVTAGTVTPDDVHADLAAIVTGARPGRTSEAERILFDSTGTALQDVAAAAIAYECSLSDERAHRVVLAAPESRT